MLVYPSHAFLDKFGDDQLLRLRDMTSKVIGGQESIVLGGELFQ